MPLSLVICCTIGSPLSWRWYQNHCHCLVLLPLPHHYWQEQKYTLCNRACLRATSVMIHWHFSPYGISLLPLILFSLAEELACLAVHDTCSGSSFLPGVVILNQAWDQLVWKLEKKQADYYSEKEQDSMTWIKFVTLSMWTQCFGTFLKHFNRWHSNRSVSMQDNSS